MTRGQWNKARIVAMARRLRRGGEEGSSLVEMALSCLILIPFLFGIVQLSIGLYCYHYASDAAREAKRWRSCGDKIAIRCSDLPIARRPMVRATVQAKMISPSM